MKQDTGGNVKGAAALGNSLVKKLNMQLSIVGANSCTPGHLSQRDNNCYSCQSLYTNVHSRLIYNNRGMETPNCPPVGERLFTVVYHAAEYYSAIRRDELCFPAAAWLDHKGTMPSEKRQHTPPDSVCRAGDTE